MKTLEAMKKEIYRFRCGRCRSQFEVDKDERIAIDWKYGEHEPGGRYDYPHNPLDHFYCPVCECVRTMDKRTIHRFFVMDNGTEVMDY